MNVRSLSAVSAVAGVVILLADFVRFFPTQQLSAAGAVLIAGGLIARSIVENARHGEGEWREARSVEKTQ